MTDIESITTHHESFQDTTQKTSPSQACAPTFSLNPLVRSVSLAPAASSNGRPPPISTPTPRGEREEEEEEGE